MSFFQDWILLPANRVLASVPYVSHTQSYALHCFTFAMVSYGEQANLPLRIKMKLNHKNWSAHYAASVSQVLSNGEFLGTPQGRFFLLHNQAMGLRGVMLATQRPATRKQQGQRKELWTRRQPLSLVYQWP